MIITVNITFVNYPPFPIRPLEAETLEDTPIIINVSYYFDDVQVPPWVVAVEASEGDWHFVDRSVQDHHFLIYYKPPLYQDGDFFVNMSVCDKNVCVPYVIIVMVTRVNYPPSIDVDHLYTIQEGQVLDITFKTLYM